MFTRRDFIKTMSLLSGAVLAPVRWLGKWASQLPLGGVQPVLAEEPPEGGELYAGFVLLPEGANAPSFVQPGREISICQIDSQKDATYIGETLQFRDLVELKRQMNFPLYTLSNLPTEVQQIETSLTQYVQSGRIWGVTICWGSQNSETEEREPAIILRGQVQHPMPCPVWPVYLQNHVIYPEKVAIASQFPGILLPSASGYVFQWIHQNILYTLIIEVSSEREIAERIAASLIEI